MKIPKWYEIKPKDINIVWETEKNGRFCLIIVFKIDGQIYIGKSYYDNCKKINLGEVIDYFGKEMSKLEKQQEIKDNLREIEE